MNKKRLFLLTLCLVALNVQSVFADGCVDAVLTKDVSLWDTFDGRISSRGDAIKVDPKSCLENGNGRCYYHGCGLTLSRFPCDAVRITGTVPPTPTPRPKSSGSSVSSSTSNRSLEVATQPEPAWKKWGQIPIDLGQGPNQNIYLARTSSNSSLGEREVLVFDCWGESPVCAVNWAGKQDLQVSWENLESPGNWDVFVPPTPTPTATAAPTQAPTATPTSTPTTTPTSTPTPTVTPFTGWERWDVNGLDKVVGPEYNPPIGGVWGDPGATWVYRENGKVIETHTTQRDRPWMIASSIVLGILVLAGGPFALYFYYRKWVEFTTLRRRVQRGKARSTALVPAGPAGLAVLLDLFSDDELIAFNKALQNEEQEVGS